MTMFGRAIEDAERIAVGWQFGSAIGLTGCQLESWHWSPALSSAIT